MRTVIWAVFMALGTAAATAAELPKGPFTNDACIECHQKDTPDLVSAWREGPHAKALTSVGCAACHGDRHIKSLEGARKSSACVTCHGGEGSPVAKSYFTSKHGVIAKLEATRWDWSKPLAEANYRAPTCAYCHMHEGRHGISAKGEALDAACLDCHSPSYADSIRDAGKRGMEIGALKVREAEVAIDVFSEDAKTAEPELNMLKAVLFRMNVQSLSSLRLGLGHQSPDYQWWYGQAALDGDLIRIKSLIMRRRREKSVRDGTQK